MPHPVEPPSTRIIRGRFGLAELYAGDAFGGHFAHATHPSHRIPPRGQVIAPTISPRGRIVCRVRQSVDRIGRDNRMAPDCLTRSKPHQPESCADDSSVGVRQSVDRIGRDNSMASDCLTRSRPHQPESCADESSVGVRQSVDRIGRDNRMAPDCLTRSRPHQPEPYADESGWLSHARATCRITPTHDPPGSNRLEYCADFCLAHG
jgi:hypothetical protein